MYDVSSLRDVNIKSGVGINRIDRGSPAEKAGLQVGDIIIGMDGKTIGSVAQLRVQLYTHKNGDSVKIKYYRNGRTADVDVSLFKYTDS